VTREEVAYCRLWLAVIRRTVEDMEGSGISATARREQALAWIMDASTTIGSFAWICRSIGLDERIVRRLANRKSP